MPNGTTVVNGTAQILNGHHMVNGTQLSNGSHMQNGGAVPNGNHVTNGTPHANGGPAIKSSTHLVSPAGMPNAHQRMGYARPQVLQTSMFVFCASQLTLGVFVQQ